VSLNDLEMDLKVARAWSSYIHNMSTRFIFLWPDGECCSTLDPNHEQFALMDFAVIWQYKRSKYSLTLTSEACFAWKNEEANRHSFVYTAEANVKTLIFSFFNYQVLSSVSRPKMAL
jgi:hypothetical protein